MSYRIIGKYIKDLDFRIPNPKTFFLLSKEIKNYKINVDIRSNKVKHNIIEVQVSLNLKPTNDGFETIKTKIVYSTIVELTEEKIKNEKIERIILIDVPNKIYGELRKIFISLFENSGFQDIKINESVDFNKLYNMRKVQ